MLTKKTTAYLITGALTVGLGVGLALAGPADDAIKGRQGCMKAHGKMMGELAKMFKGETPYDPSVIQAQIADNETACADWDKWWGPDTQKGETAETWAKPEIWSNPAGFKAAGENLYPKWVALKESKDEAGFKVAFPALGDACKGCHEKFRRPKEQ